jgi:hypothetical protein
MEVLLIQRSLRLAHGRPTFYSIPILLVVPGLAVHFASEQHCDGRILFWQSQTLHGGNRKKNQAIAEVSTVVRVLLEVWLVWTVILAGLATTLHETLLRSLILLFRPDYTCLFVCPAGNVPSKSLHLDVNGSMT